MTNEATKVVIPDERTGNDQSLSCGRAGVDVIIHPVKGEKALYIDVGTEGPDDESICGIVVKPVIDGDRLFFDVTVERADEAGGQGALGDVTYRFLTD